jgi:hypothetical protein
MLPNRIFRPLPVHRKRGETGSAMVEFLLATGLLIIPIFFGIIIIGLSLIVANQVTEVCRDTGHMFAYYVDFSQSASQLLVTQQLAQGLGMTPTGGKGVIYLSTITYVDSTSCAAAGLQSDTTNCPNVNQFVVIKRLVIGNPSVQPAAFAPSINPSIITSNGSISSANYLTDNSVRAANFVNVINLTVGQYAYVSEMFVNPPLGGIWSLFSSNVIAARSVF